MIEIRNKQEKIREASRNFYDKATHSFSRTRNFWWNDLNFIKEYVSEKDEVLDFGCGNGRLLELLNKTNIDYTGVDISRNLLKIATQKYPAKKFIFIDTENVLPFKNETFDKVFAIAVFHHFNPKMAKNTLSEIKRVVKKDGIVVITAWYLWETKHKKFLWRNFLTGRFTFLTNVTFEDAENTYQRPCYFWRKSQLEKIIKQNGFDVEKNGFSYDEKNNKKRNIYFICKKK